MNKICQVVNDAVKMMGIDRKHVLHFSSDATAYMIKAGELLKDVYTDINHTTCFAHLLNNAAEKIRLLLPNVDRLIANTKAATIKKKTRQQQFKDSSILCPPQPVST